VSVAEIRRLAAQYAEGDLPADPAPIRTASSELLHPVAHP
jgi:hypothetical protein